MSSKISLVIILFISMFSCKQGIEKKDVWLGFQLGASVSDNLKRMDKLATDGTLKIDENSKLKYYTNQMSDGVIFLTTPWFVKSDTIVAAIKILCLGNMLYATDIVQKARSNDFADNLYDNNDFNQYAADGLQGFNSTKIMNFLYEQLKEKYGECETKDTFNFPSHITIDYSWHKDGYDINLVKRINLHSTFSTNSMLILTYSYDQPTIEKLKREKNKSVY